jgi:hypothetical protein
MHETTSSRLTLHRFAALVFEHEVKPRLKGKSTLVRFADDAVILGEVAEGN